MEHEQVSPQEILKTAIKSSSDRRDQLQHELATVDSQLGIYSQALVFFANEENFRALVEANIVPETEYLEQREKFKGVLSSARELIVENVEISTLSVEVQDIEQTEIIPVTTKTTQIPDESIEFLPTHVAIETKSQIPDNEGKTDTSDIFDEIQLSETNRQLIELLRNAGSSNEPVQPKTLAQQLFGDSSTLLLNRLYARIQSLREKLIKIDYKIVSTPEGYILKTKETSKDKLIFTESIKDQLELLGIPIDQSIKDTDLNILFGIDTNKIKIHEDNKTIGNLVDIGFTTNISAETIDPASLAKIRSILHPRTLLLIFEAAHAKSANIDELKAHLKEYLGNENKPHSTIYWTLENRNAYLLALKESKNLPGEDEEFRKYAKTILSYFEININEEQVDAIFHQLTKISSLKPLTQNGNNGSEKPRTIRPQYLSGLPEISINNDPIEPTRPVNTGAFTEAIDTITNHLNAFLKTKDCTPHKLSLSLNPLKKRLISDSGSTMLSLVETALNIPERPANNKTFKVEARLEFAKRNSAFFQSHVEFTKRLVENAPHASYEQLASVQMHLNDLLTNLFNFVDKKRGANNDTSILDGINSVFNTIMYYRESYSAIKVHSVGPEIDAEQGIDLVIEGKFGKHFISVKGLQPYQVKKGIIVQKIDSSEDIDRLEGQDLRDTLRKSFRYVKGLKNNRSHLLYIQASSELTSPIK